MAHRLSRLAIVDPEHIARVVALYERRGLLERIDGDPTATAAAWLSFAREDLDGVATLIDGASYRLGYNAAYDTLRHAAEVVVQRAGGRVTSGQGGHEAVFALADALVSSVAPGVFAGVRAGVSRLKRHSLEYVSDNPISVSEADAREVLQWARDGVAAATAFVALASAPRI